MLFRSTVVGLVGKPAVTVLAADTVTLQVSAVPEQAPVQPVKPAPSLVNVTDWFTGKIAEHPEDTWLYVQEMPDGFEVTCPIP